MSTPDPQAVDRESEEIKLQLLMGINYLTLAAIVVVLIIEAVAVYYFFKYRKFRRLISSTKTSRISDLNDGFHEIIGTVTSLGQTLISPYSEKACVYYDFLVEELSGASRNPNRSTDEESRWEDLIKDEQMLRFGVDDGSGIAVVDLKYARIELKSENEYNPDLNHDMELMIYPDKQRVLRKFGIKSNEGKRERIVRYRELLLEEGLQVYVMGDVHGNDNGRPLFKVQGNPLYVSDHSEFELLDLYENKYVYSVVVMISVPLGLLLFWLMEWFQYQ